MKYEEKAITLIALIITIVILLIIAGIAIVNLTGENGLIKKTKQATDEYLISQSKEKIELEIAKLKIEKEGNGEDLRKEDLTQINNDEIDVENTESFPVTVICGKYKFYVDENFIVTYVGEADGTIVTYTTEPEGYTNQDEINVLIKVKNSNGIKIIEYPDGSTLEVTEKETEVEINYKVNKNGTYTFTITDNNNKEVIKDIVINQIDKLSPIDFTPEVTKSGSNITIKENAQDADADETSIKSGINYCEYYLVDSNNKTTKYETNEINNLGIGTYQLYVIAYDRAGNSKQSSTVEVKISVQFAKISADKSHSFAIDIEGNLWGWGNNSYTKVEGNGTLYSAIPVQIIEGTKFKEISSTEYNTLAIDEQGNLWAWGVNNYGQLGDGTKNSSNVPIQITEGIKFKKISVTDEHSRAIDEEGNLWTWGTIYLGDGTKNSSNVPIQIKEGTKFKEITAGGEAANHWNHTLTIDESGNIWSWGGNNFGQLGDGTNDNSTLPIQIKKETKFKKVASKSYHNLAIDEQGNLWAWGVNNYGQLGDGTTNTSNVPIQIKEETKFKEVAAGENYYSLAIDELGNIWSWGNNSNGQLGDGTTKSSNVPIQITEGIKFKEIAAGNNHCLAIDELGNIWSWGNNTWGQLGDGTTNTLKIPTQI